MQVVPQSVGSNERWKCQVFNELPDILKPSISPRKTDCGTFAGLGPFLPALVASRLARLHGAFTTCNKVCDRRRATALMGAWCAYHRDKCAPWQ